MVIKKRHPIRSSDIEEIVESLKPELGEEVEDLLEGRVETAKLDSGEHVILADGQPLLLKKNDKFLPLTFAADRLSLKRVIVDMGAVEPISSGADVMAPGIVEAEENIESGEIVGIEDEKNHKIVAIGIALEEGSSLRGEEGKVVENLHQVGDKFWDLREEF